MQYRVSFGGVAAAALIATASCKSDRSSNGSVESVKTPVALGSVDTTLVWNAVSFQVVGHDSSVTIQPDGMKGDNRPVSATTQGLVTGAELVDLDKDGRPELLIFSASPDSSRRLSVTGFSTTDSTLNRMDFDGVREDPRAMPGYAGHDEFAIVDGVLVQTFPVYDDRGQPTGKKRHLRYALVNGEGARLLRIDSIADY